MPRTSSCMRMKSSTQAGCVLRLVLCSMEAPRRCCTRLPLLPAPTPWRVSLGALSICLRFVARRSCMTTTFMTGMCVATAAPGMPPIMRPVLWRTRLRTIPTSPSANATQSVAICSRSTPHADKVCASHETFMRSELAYPTLRRLAALYMPDVDLGVTPAGLVVVPAQHLVREGVR